jgi:hypothetical protein
VKLIGFKTTSSGGKFMKLEFTTMWVYFFFLFMLEELGKGFMLAHILYWAFSVKLLIDCESFYVWMFGFLVECIVAHTKLFYLKLSTYFKNFESSNEVHRSYKKFCPILFGFVC